ncbi:M23 family metallopeptidase [bacterium]|nr:MAG: M23 family metallopeptidase [bacterium]
MLLLLLSFVFNSSAHAVTTTEEFKALNGIEYYKECTQISKSGGQEEPSDEPTSSGAVDESGWAFPTAAGTPISSDYRNPQRPGHRGVDLANNLGTPIYASREGTVTNSGPASGFGNWIVIQHDVDGKRVDSVYGHMQAGDLMVKVGDKVKTGQQISKIGNEGESSGAHLHYEEWEGGRGSGSDRKPVAIYGQTGKTTPGEEPAEPASPVANNTESSTAASGCDEGGSGQQAPVTPVNCAEANKSPDKSKFVWDYLRGQGLTEEQTAGVMGNLAHESGDPTFKKSTDVYEVGGANAGYGLAQWSFGRQDSLRDAGAKDPRGLNDLCFQLDYLVQESKSRERRSGSGNEWDGIKEQKTIEDAAYYFEYNYERPAPGSTAARVKYAQQYMDKYGSGRKV